MTVARRLVPDDEDFNQFAKLVVLRALSKLGRANSSALKVHLRCKLREGSDTALC